MELSHERLKHLLHYDGETGAFTWKESRRGVRGGSTAGTINGGGYVQILVDGSLHYAHRLAVFYSTGFPVQGGLDVDHIDGNKLNNAASNLRVVSRKVNQQNRRSGSGLSPFLGVSRKRNRWQATIRLDGKSKFLGSFDDEVSAHNAYLQAKRQYHEGSTL